MAKLAKMNDNHLNAPAAAVERVVASVAGAKAKIKQARGKLAKTIATSAAVDPGGIHLA